MFTFQKRISNVTEDDNISADLVVNLDQKNTSSKLLVPKLYPLKESMTSVNLQQRLQLPRLVNFYQSKLFMKRKHIP